MNQVLKNLTVLFKNTRIRAILIFTGSILIFTVIIGIIRFSGHIKQPPATAQLRNAPSIQSVPGGFDTPETAEYARLQEQQNIRQAQAAEQSGTASVPTIIQSQNLSGTFADAASSGKTACCQPCPCPGQQQNLSRLIQSSPLVPGTLVYSTQGRLLGSLGADGKVRNSTGQVLGSVGPDGLVRDNVGNVIGAASSIASPAPVYDAQGRLIGTLAPDQSVRDAQGNIIGTAGPDGVVRDNQGNVIGQVSKIPAGMPAYDSQGKYLGRVDPDGKVRDPSGAVVGTLGPDQLVRDAQGRVIGKANLSTNGSMVGAPVYDTMGRLLGTVQNQGKVVDAQGRVIGTLSADGKVRNASGQVIGKAGWPVPGAPVYDSQGNLIGTVGEDQRVYDPLGRPIGSVGPDGIVRDLRGKVLGKTGNALAGTPVYDTQGRLIGLSTPDNQILDGKGRVIGSLDAAGNARDSAGNLIGSTQGAGATAAAASTAPQSPAAGTTALPAAQSSQADIIRQQQQAFAAQQGMQQAQQEIQGQMTAQANQLLAAWAPPSQTYVASENQTGGGQQSNQGPGGSQGAAGSASNQPPVVKAGDIMFGILMTAVNSDEPGPIMVKVVEGKFKGGTLIGSLTNQGESVMLSFNTLSLPDVSKSISVNVVAIDQDTARTGLSSYTNDHYLLRYGTLFASALLQGYGQALTQSGSTVVNTLIGQQVLYPQLSPKAQFLVALGNVGTVYSSKLGNIINTPPTVYVNSGKAVGLLFLADVPALPQ